jgi:hypothetical protein
VAKRFREYKRIKLTAKTAELIRERLVDKTFDDHFVKKKCAIDPTGLTQCSHQSSGTLDVARLVEAGIKIGKKRATLDLACPYSTNNATKHAYLLKQLATRLRMFASAEKMKDQTRTAFNRAANEIQAYAERNAMEVLAEVMVDSD